jgi:hypothetical protein
MTILVRRFMERTHQAAGSRCKNCDIATSWHWQVLAVSAFICIGLASACLAFTASPTTLTFDSIQDETNPPNQTLSVYRTRSNQVTLTVSDNVSWLTVSPATAPVTNAALLTVTANTSGLAPGPPNAVITIKVGKRARTKNPCDSHRVALVPATTISHHGHPDMGCGHRPNSGGL